MKSFDYDIVNFKAVESILNLTETATKPGALGRILFNITNNRFEFYDEKELNTINIHSKFGSVRDAIKKYLDAADNNDPNAEVEAVPEMESLEEFDRQNADVSSKVEETDNDEDAIPSIPPLDEVFENSQRILSTIRDIQHTVNLERNEKILNVISDLFKLDTVSESDILKTIVENTELKKLLSLVFETFGVEVSKTVSTHDMKVSTATIKFSHKIENTIDDYKMGISQALANIRAIKASRAELQNKEEQVQAAQLALAAEKRNSVELARQVAVLTEKKDPIRELHTLAPLFYVICWKTEKGTIDYLRVRKEKINSVTEDGSYPTRYLERTSHLTRAQQFTSAAAKAQIAKIIRHKDNVTFMKLSDMQPRQLGEFFTVARVAVEKIQAVKSAE